MTGSPPPPRRRHRAVGCLAAPAAVLLIVGLVPPQLSRITAGQTKPTEYYAYPGASNGWQEMVDLGPRIRAAGSDSTRLDFDAGLVTELEHALDSQYFVAPAPEPWAPPDVTGHEDVVAAFELLTAAASQAAAAGRVARAVELWKGQLRVARTLLDQAQSDITVAMGLRSEQAVGQAVRDAMNTLGGPVRQADWQPLRDTLAKMPEPGRLAMAWRMAHWRILYAREFAPEMLPASLAPRGRAAWWHSLPPNCFHDPWYSLSNYRAALRRVTREAATPRPERDLELLRLSLEPQGLYLYNYAGRWIPAEALRGGDWRGFDGEDAQLALRRLTDTMLALRIAYDDRGTLPGSLADLVRAGLLEEVPVDPFNEWSFQYDPQRRLLWSVGPDETDDSGQSTPGQWHPDIAVNLAFAKKVSGTFSVR